MKNRKIIILTAILFATAFTSCKKDKEDPVITVSTPEEHTEHLWGAEVHINASFTDDRGLKNYEVLLGDESGSHDHDFDFEKTGDISGVSYDFHEHFVVPDSAMTMRWVHFSVTDMEDKTTTIKWMLHFAE